MKWIAVACLIACRSPAPPARDDAAVRTPVDAPPRPQPAFSLAATVNGQPFTLRWAVALPVAGQIGLVLSTKQLTCDLEDQPDVLELRMTLYPGPDVDFFAGHAVGSRAMISADTMPYGPHDTRPSRHGGNDLQVPAAFAHVSVEPFGARDRSTVRGKIAIAWQDPTDKVRGATIDGEFQAVLCGDFEDRYTRKRHPLAIGGPFVAEITPPIASTIAWREHGALSTIGFYAGKASCKTRDTPMVELRDFAMLPGLQPAVAMRGIGVGRGWIEFLDRELGPTLHARVVAYGGGSLDPEYDIAGTIAAPICDR